MCIKHGKQGIHVFPIAHGVIMKIDQKDNISNSHKIKLLLKTISDHNAAKLENKNIKLKKTTSIWKVKILLKVQTEIEWKEKN